jgi:hypothetical protein
MQRKIKVLGDEAAIKARRKNPVQPNGKKPKATQRRSLGKFTPR